MNNIARQITDIQAQAERLIRTKANMIEIEQFAQYNDEIKSFLINNIDDEFVLKYVKDIPDLKINQIEAKTGIITLLLGFMVGGWSAIYHEKQKERKALKTIRDIKGKYASAEFMLKNYFAS